jgi:hypothetical protein
MVDHSSQIRVSVLYHQVSFELTSSPGRLHHCMRSIGIASRALDLLLERVSDPVRKTFGKELREHGKHTSTYIRHS